MKMPCCSRAAPAGRARSPKTARQRSADSARRRTSLLVDQCLGVSTARWFADVGIDTVHASQIGLSGAPDEEMLRAAAELGRTVLTADKGCSAVLWRLGLSAPSLILARSSVTEVRLVHRVLRELVHVVDRLDEGAIVSLTPRGHRVRMLPIRSTDGAPAARVLRGGRPD